MTQGIVPPREQAGGFRRGVLGSGHGPFPLLPYDDFVPKLARLFERVRLAFDHGSMVLARDACAALFALLALKNDYGFAVTRPGLVVICDEQIRYVRALGETSRAGQRAGGPSIPCRPSCRLAMRS